MKFLAVVFGIVLYAAPAAAQSKFSLKAPDTLAFLLSMGQMRVNVIPVVDITLSSLPSGSTSFNVTFPQHPEIVIDQQIELKPGGASYFEVARVKGKYKLALVSESVTAPADLPGAMPQPVMNPVDFALDTLTAPAVVEEAGSCAGPVSESEFDLIKAELRETVFEVRRFEKLKVYAETHCLRAEQVRYLMAQLNTEDLKIRLLESSIGHVFDPAKLQPVEEDIFLEKNKRRVREILGAAASN